MAAKRFRVGDEVVDTDTNINHLASVLMLLSRSGGGGGDSGRVFECKTCSRQFPSFQALGGHRASHKKPRLSMPGDDDHEHAAKPRAHECSVCGLEFAIGQALGGHMRRHRNAAFGGHAGFAEKKKAEGGKRAVLLDLNLPPLDNDMECPKLGLQFVDHISTTMVDCFR